MLVAGPLGMVAKSCQALKMENHGDKNNPWWLKIISMQWYLEVAKR